MPVLASAPPHQTERIDLNKACLDLTGKFRPSRLFLADIQTRAHLLALRYGVIGFFTCPDNIESIRRIYWWIVDTQCQC